MPRVQSKVHEARTPRTPKPRAQRRRRAPAAATSEHERQVEGAEVSRGEVDAKQRDVDLEQLNSAGVEGLPRLAGRVDESSDAAKSEASADAAATPEVAPMQPDAVLALADMAVQVTCSVVGRGVEVPADLRQLSETERALLAPFSVGAAQQLGDYSAALTKYSGLIFAGFLGLFVYQRVKALRALAPQEPKSSDAPPQQAAPAANVDLPGSPFS